METANKNIYIVLTYTGTLLSKIIKLYTKKEFSHVSIALDQNLIRMYSFGRLNPYNPFVGGFIREGINKGTFKRFKKTQALILKLEVTEDQHMQIRSEIKKFIAKRKTYRFNILGLCYVLFNKKREKENYFYCAEFVKYLLQKANVVEVLPNVIKPEDFIKIENKKTIYKGKLNEFRLMNKIGQLQA